MKGKVYLVGAGPGDPGLMTLKGKRLLEQAEVLVYDRLGTSEMMGWIPEHCERIYVGKQSSDHTLTQQEINRLLVEKAQEGKRVVRLKGGDPYVFGRGGEEGLELAAAGIPFEEVPGITSAIAGLAYAGIPVTHRGVATSFHVFTAHLKEEQGRPDWDVIAGLEGTLIFLMGRASLPDICSGLTRYGKSPDTPCAVVQWGTTAQQRTVTGTLADIEARVEASGIGSPCIIAVGAVVTLREQLSFFEARPLFGHRAVVTRSRTQSGQLKGQLEALGAEVLEIPAIRIVPTGEPALDEAIGRIRDFTWLVFTSVNGVEIFFKRFALQHRDVRALGHLKVAVIGEGTAAALARHGLCADLVPEDYVAESLAEALKPVLAPEDRVLMPRAKEARAVLAEELKGCCEVLELPIYETLSEELSERHRKALAETVPSLFTFASSSTVRHFVRMAGPELMARFKESRFVSIGPVTSATMRELGLPVHAEADPHTIEGLTQAAVRAVQEGTL